MALTDLKNVRPMLTIDFQHPMMTAEGQADLCVSTKLAPGELVCLYGPSGAGKTTLLRLLAGLIKPQNGRIVYNDTVWCDTEKGIFVPPQIRRTGLMFQDYALFPNMTVEKQLRFAQLEKDDSAIDTLLELFGLKLLANRKPHQLSGGQKQRVALARALASKPTLLMLDEPLSALDRTMKAALQEEIRKAHQLLGTVTLMVSHDPDEIKSMATSVLLIPTKKEVQLCTTEEFYQQVVNPTYSEIQPTYM